MRVTHSPNRRPDGNPAQVSHGGLGAAVTAVSTRPPIHPASRGELRRELPPRAAGSLPCARVGREGGLPGRGRRSGGSAQRGGRGTHTLYGSRGSDVNVILKETLDLGTRA